MENNKPEIRYKLNWDMFNKVLAHKKISSGVKLLFLYLNKRRGYKLYCWPSQRRIANDLGVSSRQVRNQLKVLKDLKILVWKKGQTVYLKESNSYHVVSNKYDFRYITFPYEFRKKF